MNKYILRQFLVFTVVLGIATQAIASLHIQGDANYLGLINDGIPANPTAEAGYINDLITLAAGATPIVIGTETYDRVDSSLVGPFAPVVLAGAIKDDTGNTTISLVGTFQYILGKYGNQGSLVWYFPVGETGSITLQDKLNGNGLSHISAYNSVTQTIPEPASLLVWGSLAIVGTSAARRRVSR